MLKVPVRAICEKAGEFADDRTAAGNPRLSRGVDMRGQLREQEQRSVFAANNFEFA